MTEFILYQTIRDADGEDVEASRWTNDTLRDALRDLRDTRTAHCDGVQYQAARYIPHSATAIISVQNGAEFRTGCSEERTLAIIGISRWSARRLSRLLGCEWQA
jgi:hypothetical protein